MVDLGVLGTFNGKPASLVFNCSLTQSPIGGDDYMTIPMNGTMAIKTGDEIVNFPVYNLPA